jgi:hypothetical protein
MDTLPQELLDEIFRAFFVFEKDITARIATFPAEDRQAILNCRLVQRRWRDSLILERLFVNILEETPFVWHSHRIPKLEDIGDTKYGNWMSCLSLCGMDMELISRGSHEGWKLERNEIDKENSITEYLVHLLRRFSWVEHLRYYPISPKCLDGTWPEGKVSKCCDNSFERLGYPAPAEGENLWRGVECDNHWIYERLFEGVADLWLESIEMPLFGNRAGCCAVPMPFNRSIPQALRRLSLTVKRMLVGGPLYWWLSQLSKLEVLDISISPDPGCGSFLPPREIYLLLDQNWMQDQPLPKLPALAEFRLMSHNRCSFSVSEICKFLDLCPNLSKLGFAHVMLADGTWKELLRRLEPLDLESLYLLSPRNINTLNVTTMSLHGGPVPVTEPIWPSVKYEADQYLENAAQEVKLIHTESPTEPNGRPKKTLNFEYPGFAIFGRQD